MNFDHSQMSEFRFTTEKWENKEKKLNSHLSEQEWLNTEETALYLRLSVGSVRNLTSNGLIPHYKLGSRNRYRQEDLRSLLLQNKRGGIDGL